MQSKKWKREEQLHSSISGQRPACNQQQQRTKRRRRRRRKGALARGEEACARKEETCFWCVCLSIFMWKVCQLLEEGTTFMEKNGRRTRKKNWFPKFSFTFLAAILHYIAPEAGCLLSLLVGLARPIITKNDAFLRQE